MTNTNHEEYLKGNGGANNVAQVKSRGAGVTVFMELKDWITVGATIVIALVGWWVSKAIQKSQTRVKYIEIAVGILDKSPSPEKRTIREWAIRVMDKYSEVPIDEKMKEELRKYPITGTLNVTLGELKLKSEGTVS